MLAATYLYNSESSFSQIRTARPPHIDITSPGGNSNDLQEKSYDNRSFAIKLPLSPLKEEALSTSRPGSPSLHHARKGNSRGDREGYFEEKRE